MGAAKLAAAMQIVARSDLILPLIAVGCGIYQALAWFLPSAESASQFASFSYSLQTIGLQPRGLDLPIIFAMGLCLISIRFQDLFKKPFANVSALAEATSIR